MLWPGNSPDLTAIEKAWPWMKRTTTNFGAPTAKSEMVQSWEHNWYNSLPQSSIQAWIEGIVHNIQEVIRLEGGNEYKEGREAKRSYKGRRKVGELFKHAYIPRPSDADLADDDSAYEDVDDIDEEADIRYDENRC